MTASIPTRACVLIVDDHSELRLSFRAFLSEVGYAVRTAEDGRAALDHLDGSLPDIIITDIAMPRMDGIELAKSLRASARTAGIPMIAITGVVHERLGDLAVRNLFTRILRKPVFPHELVSLVAEVIGSPGGVRGPPGGEGTRPPRKTRHPEKRGKRAPGGEPGM